MKDYVKPSLRENDPKNVILHVGTNDLNSDLPPERIAKSIVDVAKNIQSDTRKVSISGIAFLSLHFVATITSIIKQ